ncbi:MAG: complex I NDUFA9 subunit family protein [Rhodospirillales bacterium]
MDGRSVATVVGGSGFIGRYVVKRLAAAGHVVRVAARDPEQAQFLKPMGRVGQVVPLFADITDDATVARAVEGAGLVVNLVGILAERRSGDFAHVQAEGAARVARLAAASGVRRLVHVSAIGASPEGPSQYSKTKAAGEAAVRAAFPRAAILRPSIVFGPEDQFFNRFGAMAALLPVMPVLAGETRFQPVYVGDVADAVMQALARPEAEGAVYELGGPRIMSFREILGWILAQTGRHKWLVPVPPAAARLLARLPFSGLTSDQLLSLSRDNVADPNLPGLAELGILPTPIDLIVPDYLARFRRAGARRGLELVADRT